MTQLFKTSLFLAVFIIWTPFLKAQDSDTITCLTNRRLDFLLQEQSNASFLRRDTSYKGGIIKDLNRIIKKQTDIQTRTESIVKLKDMELQDSKKSFDEVIVRLTKEQRHVRIWRNTTFIFVTVSAILGAVLAIVP